ncbi:MAG: type II toxin-antitoxin system HipA family toxin [Acetatifactor sp.]|nr:type II toxin-antitoxin system HipA family toxin [Acetatifactor sp.]
MTNTAEVYLWGTKIGTIWQPQGESARFEYDKRFLTSNMQVAPFKMPLSERVYSFPELDRLDAFHGMPGLLADSLPDRFGNAVIEEWLVRHGRSLESFSAIERLCYTGQRGMGALEYVPAMGPTGSNDEIDVTEMAEFASEILSGKSTTVFSDRDVTLARLMDIGSSAGGARAKAVIAWNPKTGEVKSGQVDAGAGFEHWLLKFDGVSGNGDHGVADPKQYTLIEYAYYLMAKDAGVVMQECRILEKDGRHHFMTMRFDRKDGRKQHVQTLAALGHFDYNVPRTCSYEIYADYARRLGLGKEGMQELFRRAVFNVIGVNCDDHVKNFAFLMDRSGNWSLSPAYDLTFSYNPNNRWLSAHQMTIRGKSANINDEDLLAFGKAIGLSAAFCKKTIFQVRDIFANWMEYAQVSGISEKRAEEINVWR